MLAPMEGFSHATFRRLMAEPGGVGAVCTEFVRVTDAKVSRRRLRREIDPIPGVALSVQVMGNDRRRMGEAAGIAAAAGAAIVDVNLGCPTPRAVRGGVGAAMLRDLDLLGDVLASMREQTGEARLSAKIRAGFDDSGHAIDIARTVERAGADFLVIHPRSRRDHFGGVADWRIVGGVREAVSIPVVGNGDVWYAEDAVRLRRETGCAGVMIGRPALRNPWIFLQIECLERGEKPPSPSGDDVVDWFGEAARRFREHFDGREVPLVGKLKEILRFTARALPEGRTFLDGALRQPDFAGLEAAVVRGFGGVPPDRLDLDSGGSIDLMPRPTGIR